MHAAANCYFKTCRATGHARQLIPRDPVNLGFVASFEMDLGLKIPNLQQQQQNSYAEDSWAKIVTPEKHQGRKHLFSTEVIF